MIPEDYKGVRAADVYVAGTLAAHLTKDQQGTVTFSYKPGYRGRPVATTLPLDAPPLVSPAGALPAFFAGLLPEGYRLTLLRAATKTSLDDEFTLLLAVGQDTPGNIQVVPAGQLPSETPALLVGNPETLDFSQLFVAVDSHALPGVQAKASAQMMTATATGGDGTSALVKVNPGSYPQLVQNEYAHLRAAQVLKLPVASAQLVCDSLGVEGLWISRFDRGEGGARYAFEDSTQVLGVHPAQKYSLETERVISALADLAVSPLIARRNLYLQFVYAWLTGNGDLHGKNIGVLESARGGWEVAPIYDVPCTLAYGDNSLALPVAGRTRNLRRRHWLELADSIGLPLKAAVSSHRLALTAAASVDWGAIGLEGSSVRGAQRELRFRRYELEREA